MSDILFPAGLTIDLSDLNLEVVRDYVRQWNLRYTQMQKGLFTGGLFFVHTPRIQISHAKYSLGFMTEGEFPDNCILLAYVRSKAELSLYHEALYRDELVILKKGEEINFLANGENELFTVAVEKVFFHQAFYHFFGESFEAYQQQRRFAIHPQLAERLFEKILLWMDTLKGDHSLLLEQTNYNMIESEILGNIFESLMIDSTVKKRNKFKISAVHELFMENLKESKCMADIIQELNISERQVRRLFKDTLGITPKQYFQNLRLNAIRNELLSIDKSHSFILDIALNYNFFHMGHFSSEYKKLFGEFPSETRKK